MTNLFRQATFDLGGNTIRPMGDQWCSDPAFVHVPVEHLDVAPLVGVGPAGAEEARRQLGAAAGDEFVDAAAVVGGGVGPGEGVGGLGGVVVAGAKGVVSLVVALAAGERDGFAGEAGGEGLDGL